MVVAFSTKLVRSSYKGPIFNIRRSTDNALKDFYVDTAGTNIGDAYLGAGTSLATWLGGGTAYVATWYDQSGLGLHVSQSTQSRQPTLVNGKPVFDKTRLTCLERPYTAALNTAKLTYVACCTPTGTNTDFEAVVSARTISPLGGYILYRTSEWQFYNLGGSGGSSVATGVAATAGHRYKIAASIDGTTSFSYSINGSNQTATMGYVVAASNPWRIGAGVNENATTPGFPFNGEITEVMYFNSALATSERDVLLMLL